MKLLLYHFAAAALLCGCNKPAAPTPPDPRIAQLETRLAALEISTQTNIAELYQRNENRKESISNLLITASVHTYMFAVQQIQFDDLSNSFVGSLKPAPVRAQTYSAPAAVAKPAPVAAAGIQALRNGVPQEIFNRIVADAQNDYPIAFDMQEFRIKHQVEAYKRLHP